MTTAPPPVDDVLRASGLLTLGDDPPAEAVEIALRRLGELSNGGDPLRVAALRDGAGRALRSSGLTEVSGLLEAALGPGPEMEPSEWPEDPDLPGNIEPDPLPVDVLPPVLRRWARSVSDSVQVADDVTALLSLCAVSTTVAGRVVVRVDGAWDREWVALYGVLVADPAERKSPAYRHMTDALREWEAERAREVAPRARAASEVVDVAEARLTSAKRAAASGNGTMEEVEAASLKLEEARRNVPVIPQLLASDATPEALVRLMAEQGGRMAVLSPEGGPLRILDGRYSDGAARLEELAQSYDGETLRVSRIGRDPLVVEHPALTLGVAIQPSVLETIRNGRSLRGQGIFGRIAWVLPRSRMGRRLDSSEVTPLDLEAGRMYARTLHALLSWGSDTDEDGTAVPHVLTLSDEAAEVKRAYHYEVEAALSPGGELDGIPDWAGKVVGRAVRVAALLDLAARASEGRPLVEPITGWAMQSAVRLCRALTGHAVAVYGELDMDRRTSDLRYLLDRLRDLPPETTETELRAATRGRTSIEGAEDLADLVDELETRGCVRRVHPPHSGPGRPPSAVLALHPSLPHRHTGNTENPAREADEGDKRDLRYADAGAEALPELFGPGVPDA